MDESDRWYVSDEVATAAFRHGPKAAQAARDAAMLAPLATPAGGAAVGGASIDTDASYIRGTVGARFQESISFRDGKFSGGCAGDGETNDTDAWLAALEWLATGNRRLLLPAGRYLISEQGLLDIGGSGLQSIEIAGDGFGAVIVPDTAGGFTGTSVIKITGTDDSNRATGVRLRNISIIGSRAAGDPMGLETDYAGLLNLDDFFVQNLANTGVSLRRTEDIVAVNLRINNCGDETIDTGTTLVNPYGGLRVWNDSDTATGNQASFNGCTVEANRGRAVTFQYQWHADWNGGKIHGLSHSSSGYQYARELLWVESSPNIKISSHFAQCRVPANSGALRLTGSARSQLILSRSSFIYFDDDTNKYDVYCDNTDASSCFLASDIVTGTYYSDIGVTNVNGKTLSEHVYIASGWTGNNPKIGNWTNRSGNTKNVLYDARTTPVPGVEGQSNAGTQLLGVGVFSLSGPGSWAATTGLETIDFTWLGSAWRLKIEQVEFHVAATFTEDFAGGNYYSLRFNYGSNLDVVLDATQCDDATTVGGRYLIKKTPTFATIACTQKITVQGIKTGSPASAIGAFTARVHYRIVKA